MADGAKLLKHLVAPEEWMFRAACRGKPLDDFFLRRGASPRPGKKTCARCPVQAQCNDYADRTGSVGMWSGEVRSNPTSQTDIVAELRRLEEIKRLQREAEEAADALDENDEAQWIAMGVIESMRFAEEQAEERELPPHPSLPRRTG